MVEEVVVVAVRHGFRHLRVGAGVVVLLASRSRVTNGLHEVVPLGRARDVLLLDAQALCAHANLLRALVAIRGGVPLVVNDAVTDEPLEGGLDAALVLIGPFFRMSAESIVSRPPHAAADCHQTKISHSSVPGVLSAPGSSSPSAAKRSVQSPSMFSTDCGSFDCFCPTSPVSYRSVPPMSPCPYAICWIRRHCSSVE